MITYEVKPIADLDPRMVERDLGEQVDPDFVFALLRSNENTGRVQIWSIHRTEPLAKAAVRRNKSRDISAR